MKFLKIGAGLLISGVCLFFALQGIDFGKVFNSLGTLNWFWIILTVIPFVLVVWLKIWRWQVLLHPDQIGWHRLFSALMISYLWNTVLPARLGEVVRAYTVSRTHKVGTIRVFSSILLEKILDIITMFVFILILLPFLNIDNGFKTGAFILGGAMVGAFLICLLMAWQRKRAEAVINFFLKPLPEKLRHKLFEFASEVLDAVSILLHPRLSLVLWGLSIPLWVINAFIYQWVALAVGLPMGFELGMLVMIASNLGMAVPAAPGYVGTFELVIMSILPASLGAAYANRDLVFTYALLEHFVGFVPVVLLGAYYSWREGLSLGKVDKVEEEKDEIKAGELTPAVEKK